MKVRKRSPRNCYICVEEPRVYSHLNSTCYLHFTGRFISFHTVFISSFSLLFERPRNALLTSISPSLFRIFNKPCNMYPVFFFTVALVGAGLSDGAALKIAGTNV